MGTLRDFSLRVSKIAAALPKGANTVKRKVALAVLQPVVFGTPVGNTTLWTEQSRRRARPGYVGGRARANWHVSLGEASKLITEVRDKAGAATVARGKEAINAAQPEVAIHITNNLPYIGALNDGHSHQAPGGFVELAVMQGIQKARALHILDEV